MAEGSLQEVESVSWSKRILPFGILVLLVAVWFWPITIAGQRPVSSEILSVHLPAMTYYDSALRHGRLPLWNEQSGFGVPVLAEGQIGALYPLHLLLYGLFDAHDAYANSMVLHFVLAGWFAYLCARGFQLNRWASILTAVVFIGQGFFIGHQSQQWSYTTGCWLPLAVLAVWRWLNDGAWYWLCCVTLVLAVQLLGGHFQIAFYTQLVIVMLAGTAVLFAQGRRCVILWRSLLLPPAMVGALAMAAIQLVPTAELLIWGSARGRNLEYITSFATHPLALINYIAPTLLAHPLWKPTVWVPWHTAHLESLPYIGLLPFGLALWAIGVGRRDEKVRVWCMVLFGSLALSIIPSLPNIRLLMTLPGFEWFPGAARWSIVSGLFLGLLAGRGLERIEPVRFHRWCRAYVAVAVIVLVLGMAGIIAVTARSDQFNKSPDRFLWNELLSHGYTLRELRSESVTFKEELSNILAEELTLPAVNLGLLVVISLIRPLYHSKRRLMLVVLVWSIFDLSMVTATLRDVSFEPDIALVERSRVLGEVAARTSGRVIAPFHNLWMLAGAAPLGNDTIPDTQVYWSERTSVVADLFWPRSSFAIMSGRVPRWWDMGLRLGMTDQGLQADDVEFLRLADVRMLVREPVRAFRITKNLRLVKRISDPWLTMYRYKAAPPSWVSWTLWQPDVRTSRAWTFPLPATSDAAPGTDPRLFRRPPPARRRMLEHASPADRVIVAGERVKVSGTADSPAVLVLADMLYLGWHAELTQNGTTGPVPIESAFGGWRAVEIPESGRYEVTFEYRPESFLLGRRITLATIAVWLAFSFVTIMIPPWPSQPSGASSP